eukprot:symbB.v1.2.022144.t2/scaffold1909.1/size96399/8
MGVDPNASAEGSMRSLQAAVASGSIDVCAALLLHGASLEVDLAVPGIPAEVRSLLELFKGRPPQAGELPKVVNSLDPLLRPQVTQMLMDLVASQATRPAVPSGPVAPVAAPVAMVSPAPKAPVQAQRTKPSVKASESASPVPKSLSVKPTPTARENSQHVGSMSRQQVNGTAHVEAKSHSKTHLVGKESGKEQEVTTQTRPITSVAVSKGPKSPLLQAVEEGDLASVTKLLNARAEPNDYDREGETPLFTAASHGSPDVVATLLMCNAEPLTRSIRGRTPWDVASGDAIRSLLNFFAGQELDSKSSEVLLTSLGDATVDAIRLELSERAANRRGLRPVETDADGAAVTRRRPLPPLPPEDLNQDPLACAARSGDVDEVVRLLEGGCDPNVGDELGETPLFEAASAGSVNVVAALLVHRANPQQKSLSGGIAADLATESVTKSLLATYAGIKVSDDEKAACCRAIQDDELREAVANKFRADMFRGAEPVEQKPSSPFYPVSVECVTDVDKMHYFDMTRLGAFLAIPVVYQSYYNGDAYADAKTFEEEKKAEAIRRAEEEAARQAAIDAGEAEPEAVEPPEEKQLVMRGTDVKMVLCLDTLGTNTAFEESNAMKILELAKACSQCKSKTEFKQVDNQVLSVIDDHLRAEMDEHVAECADNVEQGFMEQLEAEQAEAEDELKKELIQKKFAFLKALQVAKEMHELIGSLTSWVYTTSDVMNVVAALAYFAGYKKADIYPRRKSTMDWQKLKMLLNAPLVLLEKVVKKEIEGPRKDVLPEHLHAFILQLASPAEMDGEKAKEISPAFQLIFNLVQAGCAYRNADLELRKAEFNKQKEEAGEEYEGPALEDLDDDFKQPA